MHKKAITLFAAVGGSALLSVACGLAEPTAGTTRFCPAELEGATGCYQQCADLAMVECSVSDKDGEDVAECAKDESTRVYLRDADGNYVIPAGSEACFALLLEDDEGVPDACEAGVVLGVAFVKKDGEAFAKKDGCFDLTCGTAPKEECPKL